MRQSIRTIVCLSSLCWGWGQLPAADVDFNRDVRPILSDLCFQCHGPDKSQRKADLRLDLQAGLLGTDTEPSVVVKGKVSESELFTRLIETDADLHMPPAKSGKKITPAQIDHQVMDSTGCPLAETLVIHSSTSTRSSNSQSTGLGAQPDRYLHPRAAGTARHRPFCRGNETDAHPSAESRLNRAAPHIG